jgi:predicted DNA-binding transcriptional regulator AlpA
MRVQGNAMQQQDFENEKPWTPEECADYLSVARWTFVNRISKLPTFPRPKIEVSRRMRRWSPDEVRDWSYRTGRRRPN